MTPEQEKAIALADKFAWGLVRKAVLRQNIPVAMRDQIADELHAECSLTIASGINKYNGGKAKLSTYLCRSVLNNMARGWCAIHPLGRSWVQQLHGRVKRFVEVTHSPHEGVTEPREPQSTTDEWDTVLAAAHPIDRPLLRKVFVDGMDYPQVGRETGVSAQRIGQCVHRALDRIRGNEKAMRILAGWQA